MDSMKSYQSQQIAAENSRFMSGVYLWMTLGVALTAFVSIIVSNSAELLTLIFQNTFIFYGLLIAEIGMVLFLSYKVKSLSHVTATVLYILYAALSGVTFSVIFLAYAKSTIQSAFFITSFAFAGLSAFGYFTKKDLGPIGTFCSMGLFGLIGFGLMSMFFPSLMGPTASHVYGLVGLLVFSGLTAYDTQKIKNGNIIGNEGTSENHKETIMGALTLYLDFINLFLMILRLMNGGRKN